MLRRRLSCALESVAVSSIDLPPKQGGDDAPLQNNPPIEVPGTSNRSNQLTSGVEEL